MTSDSNEMWLLDDAVTRICWLSTCRPSIPEDAGLRVFAYPVPCPHVLAEVSLPVWLHVDRCPRQAVVETRGLCQVGWKTGVGGIDAPYPCRMPRPVPGRSERRVNGRVFLLDWGWAEANSVPYFDIGKTLRSELRADSAEFTAFLQGSA